MKWGNLWSDDRARIFSRFDVELIDFVRPDGPYPDPIREMLTLAYLLELGDDPKYDTPDRWGTYTIAGLLDGRGCVNIYGLDNIRSLEFVRKAFNRALLGYEVYGYERWREDCRIGLRERHRIFAPHRRGGGLDSFAMPERYPTAHAKIETWLRGPHKPIAVPLNHIHTNARDVECIRLRCLPDWFGRGERPRRYLWHIDFGLGLTGSLWWKTLADQQPGEPLEDVFERAHAYLRMLQSDAGFLMGRHYAEGMQAAVYRIKPAERGCCAAANLSSGVRHDRMTCQRELVSAHRTEDEAIRAALALAKTDAALDTERAR